MPCLVVNIFEEYQGHEVDEDQPWTYAQYPM